MVFHLGEYSPKVSLVVVVFEYIRVNDSLGLEHGKYNEGTES